MAFMPAFSARPQRVCVTSRSVFDSISGWKNRETVERFAFEVDKRDGGLFGGDVQLRVPGFGPETFVTGFFFREVPRRAAASRKRVMDAFHDVVHENVIVPIEEDLHLLLLHQLMDSKLFTGVPGA